MSNIIYNGSSEGFSKLCQGYVDYAIEVLARRSVPDLRDGLKPVSRRVLYACSQQKNIYENLTKCATLVGRALEYHPHGDSSVYKALCSMVDSNGSMNIPLFKGQGELGKVVSKASPAAMRYPKAKFKETAFDYFRDMSACKMVHAEEGQGYEPEVLPVRYPAALVNGTSGMAVSVSTTIPSFNFLDVVNLTQEYLKTGKMETVIVPDFPTGGILVKNEFELYKLMHTGKGKLKVRAKVDIEGKTIHVKELPYGKTIESILDSLDSLDLQGIQGYRDATGRNTDTLIEITCKSLKVVDQVLMQLYKYRVLQSSIAGNMLFVENENPVFTGVYGVIERWVAWRKSIVKIKFEKELQSILPELEQLEYFMRLVQNEEWKSNMLNKLAYKSRKEGKEYLKEIFNDIPDSVCDWIIKRDVPAYNNGDRYAKRYSDLLENKKLYEHYLNDLEDYIYNDLEELKQTRHEFCARKTKATTLDYRFSSIRDSEIEDDSYCVYTLFSDGFLTKTRDFITDSPKEIVAQVEAQANSTLIGFDCYGRLLRVFGTEIPFTKAGENGEYLPRYFGVDGIEGVEDYRVMYLGLLDGKKRMLVYRDGFVGFLDTSEWVGKKKVKIVQKGVDVNVYNALVEVLEEDEFSDYLVVAEDSGKQIRFGVTEIKSIREASRKSRAKVFGGNEVDIKYVATMTYMELLQYMEDPFHYLNKMKPIGKRAMYGDASVMKEGRYYGK